MKKQFGVLLSAGMALSLALTPVFAEEATTVSDQTEQSMQKFEELTEKIQPEEVDFSYDIENMMFDESLSEEDRQAYMEKMDKSIAEALAIMVNYNNGFAESSDFQWEKTTLEEMGKDAEEVHKDIEGNSEYLKDQGLTPNYDEFILRSMYFDDIGEAIEVVIPWVDQDGQETYYQAVMMTMEQEVAGINAYSKEDFDQQNKEREEYLKSMESSEAEESTQEETTEA